jgi:hypothetical protein
MTWFLFTAACAAALIALGVLAVDERDVVWEATFENLEPAPQDEARQVARWQPRCGYCRAALRPFAVVCPDCDRSLDWLPHKEECRWCLADQDVDYMNDLFDALKTEDEPLAGPLASFPIAYFKGMQEGACSYCGGLKHVMKDGAEVDCPVCFGGGKCIACGGDRSVVLGDESAAGRLQEWREAVAQAEDRSRLTGQPVEYALLLRDAVRDLRGYAEAEHLSDARKMGLLHQGRQRVEEAFRALVGEYQRGNGVVAAPPSGRG